MYYNFFKKEAFQISKTRKKNRICIVINRSSCVTFEEEGVDSLLPERDSDVRRLP